MSLLPEERLGRWMPHLVLAAALAAVAVWWAVATFPPMATVEMKKVRRGDSACSVDCSPGCEVCGSMGDCGDCSSCDCGSCDCGGADCGSCSTAGAHLDPPGWRRGAGRALGWLVLGAPLVVLGAWRRRRR